MTPAARQAIERFLGETAASGGPFALLGITPGSAEPATVRAALERQLERVEKHPHAHAPEAEDVRLALHAAAAQLLDDRVRDRLIAVWLGNAGIRPELPPTRANPPAPKPSFEEVEAARNEAARRKRHRTLIGIGLGAFIFLLIGATGLILLFPVAVRRASAPPVAPTPAPTAGDTAPPAPVEAQAPTPAPKPAPAGITAPSDAVAAIRLLRDAATLAPTNAPRSADSLAAGSDWLADNWPRMETGQRRAAIDAIVEFAYASQRISELWQPFIDDLADQSILLGPELNAIKAGDLLPSIWSSGVIIRLGRERELRSEIAIAIERAVTTLCGKDRPRADASSFEAGAALTLRRAPLRIVTKAAEKNAQLGISHWIAAAGALAGGANSARTHLLLDALEQIMAEAPDPDKDHAVFEAIRLLATETPWREGEPSRERLVGWFVDPRISNADLSVLTSTLASSGAPGITSAMALSWNSQPLEREQLRDQYAAAWSVSTPGVGPAGASRAHRLFDNAHELLTRAMARSTDELQDLAFSVELARLHASAREIYAGRSREEPTIPQNDPHRIMFSLSGGGGGTPPPSMNNSYASDGEWALAYLNAGPNIPIRLERLKDLSKVQGGIGPLDAEVLMEAATIGGPAEVKRAAQQVVERFGGQTTILNATLEILPRAPRLDSISRMIERLAGAPLPKAADPRWPVEARRALVQSLVERLATQRDNGGLDRLVEMLTLAYDLDAPAAPTDSLSAPPPAPGSPDQLTALFRELRLRADQVSPNDVAPIPLDAVDRRRAGRAALAIGPVQTWNAEQTALAEVLSYVTSGEIRAAAPRVKAVMDGLGASRREARHIFEQIKVTEAALLRLWLIRLGEEDPWSKP